MDLTTAVSAHAEWKLKLRGAIQKHEQLDAASISSDTACKLGKWLHGEAKGKYGAMKSYASCVEKHAAFHREAGKIAAAINAGNYSDAEAMLAGGTPYSAASSTVGGAILGLKKEANL
jgi:hypothetical protein